MAIASERSTTNHLRALMVLFKSTGLVCTLILWVVQVLVQGQAGAQPLACEESGLCSVGKTQYFNGDIDGACTVAHCLLRSWSHACRTCSWRTTVYACCLLLLLPAQPNCQPSKHLVCCCSPSPNTATRFVLRLCPQAPQG